MADRLVTDSKIITIDDSSDVLNRQKNLKPVVDLLTDFKRFCDSVITQLTVNQIKDYQELSEKFNALVIDGRLGVDVIESKNTTVDGIRTSLSSKSEHSMAEEEEVVDNEGQEVSGHHSTQDISRHETIDIADEEEEEENCDQTVEQLSHRVFRSDPKLFRCDHIGCHFSSENKYSLKQHRAIHSPDRPYPCPVMSCRMRFKTTCRLSMHTKKCHPNVHRLFKNGQRPFLCVQCGTRFKYQVSLDRHVCEHRPASGRSSRRSQPPRGSNGTEVSPPDLNSCQMCSKVFDTQTALDAHKAVDHVVDGRATAVTAQAANPRPAEASKEVMDVYKKNCNTCGQVFQSPEALAEHRLIVHRVVTVAFIRRGTAPTEPRVSWPQVSSTSGLTHEKPKKPKPTPDVLFAEKMRQFVESELKKEMARRGRPPPTAAQVSAELDNQWKRLSEEHRKIFVDQCVDEDLNDQTM